MRLHGARCARLLAAWLTRWAERWDPQPVVTLTIPADGLYATARLLVRQADRLPASGEYKRHHVVAALQRHDPEATPRAIALAIEAALEER